MKKYPRKHLPAGERGDEHQLVRGPDAKGSAYISSMGITKRRSSPCAMGWSGCTTLTTEGQPSSRQPALPPAVAQDAVERPGPQGGVDGDVAQPPLPHRVYDAPHVLVCDLAVLEVPEPDQGVRPVQVAQALAGVRQAGRARLEAPRLLQGGTMAPLIPCG